MDKNHNGDRFRILRDQAESKLRDEHTPRNDQNCEDTHKLVHELRVHEIELEMQNDELLRAQDQLELSRRDYTDLFDFAPIGYLVFDGNGIIRKANLKSGDMFRKSRSELTGSPLTAYIDRNYQDTLYLFRKELKNAVSSRACELRLTNGTFVIFEGVFVGDNSDIGEMYRLAIIDISKQKLMEEDRMRLKEEILRLQKLEGLRSLAGGVAHDLNNFMQAIIGNAEIAEQLIPRDGEPHDYVEGILRSARNATHLAKQMLSYSGKDRVVSEPVMLSELARNNMAIMKAAVNKKTELVLEVEEYLPLIMADPQQLQQVLVNLIMNADEAIGGKTGKVTLSTGTQHADEAYLKDAYLRGDNSEGEYVFMEVSDTGHGIQKDDFARLFDPFYSTKSGGRGLGLSMVLSIIRSHGASLVVDSIPGEGTSFRVLFPYDESTAERKPELKPTSKDFLKGRTVLLVDDDPQILSATKRLLERSGGEVVTARDGREAVEKFKDSPEKFSVVIMDLLMPVMSGDDAGLEIRGIRPDISLIFSSGYHKKDLSMLHGGRGITVELEKPFSKNLLLENIQYVIEQSG